jgi:hypothetical protein
LCGNVGTFGAAREFKFQFASSWDTILEIRVKFNKVTEVKRCTPVEYKYFPKVYFVMLHTWVAMVLTYCKSVNLYIVVKVITSLTWVDSNYCAFEKNYSYYETWIFMTVATKLLLWALSWDSTMQFIFLKSYCLLAF